MHGRGDRRESVEPISMVRVAGGWREGTGGARKWRWGYRKGDNDGYGEVSVILMIMMVTDNHSALLLHLTLSSCLMSALAWISASRQAVLPQ